MFLGYNFSIMKKYIVIFVIIMGLAFFIARQDERASQQSAEESTQLDKHAFPAIPNEKHPDKDIPNSERHAPSWLLAFFRWPNGTATWVVILTLMAIAEQTQETAKAAKATEASVGAVNRQASLMERQIDLAIAKDRARLIVELVPAEQSISDDVWEIEFKAINLSTTLAFDVMLSMDYRITESHTIPIPSQLLYCFGTPNTAKGEGTESGLVIHMPENDREYSLEDVQADFPNLQKHSWRYRTAGPGNKKAPS